MENKSRVGQVYESTGAQFPPPGSAEALANPCSAGLEQIIIE